MKKLAVLFFALTLGLFSYSASATQSNLVTGNFPTTSPYSGLTLVQNVNTAMTVLSSNNAGASAPSYAASDMLWANTTANLLSFTPNGTNFYPMGYFGSSQWTAASDGVIDDAITATGSANAYVVTYSPVPTALVSGHVYKFFANFSITGAATVNFNSLGALPLKKQGGTALATGDIGNNQFVACAYDGTNCQIVSQLATSGSGGVTSIATTSPVCGGTITSTGTLSLCAQANNTVLANITGGSAGASATAVPVATSWGVGTTSSAAGNVLHSPSTNALALSTNGTDAITAFSDQGLATAGATGGDQGSGTINATALYVNGVAIGGATGFTKLHTQTCTSGSPCSSVTFNNSYFTSSCQRYSLKITNIYTSDGGPLCMNFSSNNGSSYSTATTFSTCTGGSYSAAAALLYNGNNPATGMSLTQLSSVSADIGGMAVASSQPTIQVQSYSYVKGVQNFGDASSAGSATYNAVQIADQQGGTMVGIFTLGCYVP